VQWQGRILLRVCVSRPEIFGDMDTLIVEPADASNPAQAPWLAIGSYWRGVGDPFRWPDERAHVYEGFAD
jgi:hypothetical protein